MIACREFGVEVRYERTNSYYAGYLQNDPFRVQGARFVGCATLFCAPVAAGDIRVETHTEHKTLRVFGAHKGGAHPTLALSLCGGDEMRNDRVPRV